MDGYTEYRTTSEKGDELVFFMVEDFNAIHYPNATEKS